jgi:hypothetical protein
MRTRIVTACLAGLMAALASLAWATGSRAATSLDDQMKTATVALQAIIERQGERHLFVYPLATAVRPGSELPYSWWPRDPWTGAKLTPGRGRGHFSYQPAVGRRSYRLVGHLSGGRAFVLSGGMPHSAKLAYDHRGQEGLNLIRQYVEMWSRTHAGRLPTASQVSRDGAVGRQNGGLFWPSNPWDHGPMAQRHDRGSFAYELTDAGTSYELRLHRALKDDYVLTGPVLEQAGTVAWLPVHGRLAIWGLWPLHG